MRADVAGAGGVVHGRAARAGCVGDAEGIRRKDG